MERAASAEPIVADGTSAEPKWNKDDWQSLLRRIEDEKVGVIPVLGPDLVTIGEQTLTQYLADQLAQRLGIKRPLKSDHAPYDTVVKAYLAADGSRTRPAEELCDICLNLDLPTPPLLRAIAGIEHFCIFVTTGFDPLLSRALREVRHVEPEVIAYAPKQILDLPGTLQQMRARGRPVVYQLLGEPSTKAVNWAITEEDCLEFYHALQAPNRQPELLFSELKDKHLLLLGGGHPDWLARFFLRTIKGERLSVQRGVEELIADPAVFSAENKRLRSFLKRYSPQTRLYPTTTPGAFIADLYAQYLLRHPGELEVPASSTASVRPPPVAPAHAIFLSYAREDLAAVQKIYASLSAAGIPAWFDMERLESGDDYRRKIIAAIDQAPLFIPVISRAAFDKRPRFFRLEWEHAADRIPLFARGQPYVIPVIIDETSVAEAPVPDQFLDFDIACLRGGVVTDDFLDAVRRKWTETK